VTHRFLPSAIGLVVVAGLAIPGFAFAQGNGRPKAPKAPVPTTTSPTTSSATVVAPDATVPVSTFRQFGAWLDDASAPTWRGEGYSSIGVGYFRLAGSSQMSVPTLGMGMGLSDRLQVSASVPFYRTSYAGTTYSGLDDMYFGAKYTVIDPTLTISEFGLAVNPLVEVLSAGNADRVHFALPVSMELRRQPFRVYGSAGYFTRGSVFSGAALEWTGSRIILTGSLTQSYSIKEDLVLDSMSVSRQHMDVSSSVAVPLTSRAAAFVSVGRSLSKPEEGGTSLALSGGLSIRFSAPSATP
jgi:hypothetical protein